MAKKRPCGICRRWFEPHVRAGDRQTVCSATECQRERHLRSCAAWHRANPAYDAKRRLTAALGEGAAAQPEPLLDTIDWPVVERAIGPAHRAVTEGIARLLLRAQRDAVPRETAASTDESRKHLNTRSRDAVPSEMPASTDESRGLPLSGRETQSAKAARPP